MNTRPTCTVTKLSPSATDLSPYVISCSFRSTVCKHCVCLLVFYVKIHVTSIHMYCLCANIALKTAFNRLHCINETFSHLAGSLLFNFFPYPFPFLRTGFPLPVPFHPYFPLLPPFSPSPLLYFASSKIIGGGVQAVLNCHMLSTLAAVMVLMWRCNMCRCLACPKEFCCRTSRTFTRAISPQSCATVR